MYLFKFFKKFTRGALFVAFLAVLVVSLGIVKLSAEAPSVSYPFAKGQYALANAPTIAGQTTQQAATFQWFEQIFDSAADLREADYLAVEYQNVVGNPGLTIGIMSGGQRFGTYTDGLPVYFVAEDGTVTELSVLYASVNLGVNAKGMILLPISSLSLVSWGVAGSTLESSSSFFFETNAEFNWGFQMKIGEVGYLKDGVFTKLLDLSTQIKSDKKYASLVEVTYPAEAVDTTKALYPFKKGDYALANAPKISAPATQAEGDSWLWHESIFDEAVDLRNATYVAFEVENVVGNPGITFGVMSEGQRFGTYTDGLPVYFVTEDGTVTELSVLYGSVNLGVGAKGMVVLPISILSIVSWGDQSKSLISANSFFVETNAKYNWGFQMKVGEVAYTSGPLLGGQFTKVLDLSTQIKTDKVLDSIFTVEFPATATDTTKEPTDVIYPFSTGLTNGPTVKSITEQAAGASWHWFEEIFTTPVDLTSATYVGLEFKLLKGNPGLTIGVMSNGARFGIYTDGLPVYFVDKDANVTELSVLYGAVNFGANAEGMILLPLSSLSIVSWGDQSATLSNATSFFIETNGQYNWDFEFQVGDVGFYTADPMHRGEMVKLLDLTSGMKKGNFSASVFTLEFPASSSVTSINGMTADYPFHSGANGFNNSMAWVGTASGDAADNWQTFRAQIPTTDLTGASYVAVQYKVTAGAPGITFGVENNGTRYSIVGSSGEEICVMNENGEIARACYITYDAATIGAANYGCLLISVSLLKYQFGDAEKTLSAVNSLIFTTNSKYNWAFEILIGEIGYYTGQPCDEDFTYYRLSGLNFGTEDYKYSATSDNPANRSTTYVFVTEQTIYGDTKIEYTATGKIAGSIIPWTGGAAGTQEMTTDSYGKQALLLTCTGPREGADAYTAFTIFDGKHIEWENYKGITLWARNDSDIEVSFNLEIDVLSSHTSSRGRFNITQGNRFWLYDVNTGEQTIYMTRPCVTLPVGFEGWVRIPFTAFDQAEWSKTDANYGVFERQYFMTEGSYVPYMGITVYSGNYTGASFAVNMIGGYQTTPSFISALVPATPERKDILALMGLDA